MTSWYNEPVDQLDRAVHDAIDCGVTHYIALDGRYSHFPGPDTSPPEQAAAIRAACASRGIPCWTETYTDVTESAKRSELFRRGYTRAGATPNDWFFVHDADHAITGARDLKPYLATVTGDVVDAYIVERDDSRFDHTTERRFARTTYRAIPGGITVDPDSHWHYRDQDGRILWGFNSIPVAGTLPVLITNHSTARDEDRVDGRETYYDTRKELELEKVTAPDTCYYCDLPPDVQINADLRYERLPDRTWDITYRRTLFVCQAHWHKQRLRNTRSLEYDVAQTLRQYPHMKAELDRKLAERYRPQRKPTKRPPAPPRKRTRA